MTGQARANYSETKLAQTDLCMCTKMHRRTGTGSRALPRRAWFMYRNHAWGGHTPSPPDYDDDDNVQFDWNLIGGEGAPPPPRLRRWQLWRCVGCPPPGYNKTREVSNLMSLVKQLGQCMGSKHEYSTINHAMVIHLHRIKSINKKPGTRFASQRKGSWLVNTQPAPLFHKTREMVPRSIWSFCL